MPGPCPQGYPTQRTHKDAHCRDRERCTGPGCRVRRAEWHEPLLDTLQQRAELAKLQAAADAAA